LDPRRERLITSRWGGQSRLTIEALARVFHQGPGILPNMTGCSFAVRHLLRSTAQWFENVSRKMGWTKNRQGRCTFGGSLGRRQGARGRLAGGASLV